jgi:hypothetical protein
VNNPLLIVKKNYNVLNVTIVIAIFLANLILRNVYDMIGYHSWHLFNFIQRQKAFGIKRMHELYHDMRYSVAFTCH